MTKDQVPTDVESILKALLSGNTIAVQLPHDNAANNLKKSLGKRYQKVQLAMQAAHYAALPEGSNVPYHDGGLNQQTIGYTADRSSGLYHFVLREKQCNAAFARKCYLVESSTKE